MSNQRTSRFSFNPKFRAQGMVEFTLVIPIFLVLVLGVLELGRLLFVYSAVFSASREAARYGAAVGMGPNGRPYFQDCTGMRDAAKRIGNLAGLQDGDITIVYDNPDSGKSGITCNDLISPSTPKSDQIELGDRVIVTVNHTYEPVVGFLGLPNFNISSTSKRTIVRELRFDGPTPLPSLTVGPGTASAMTATSNAITATAGYYQTATKAAQQTATASVLTATAAFNQTATATALTATASFEQTETAAFQQTGTATALTATASYEQTLAAIPTATSTASATPTATATLTPTPKPTITPTPKPVCPAPQPFTIAANGTSFTIIIDNTAPNARTLVLDHLHADWQSYGYVSLEQIETHLVDSEDPPVVVWDGSIHNTPVEIDDWEDETGPPVILPGQVMELTFTFDRTLNVTNPAEWWVRLVFSGNCVNTWTMEN